MHEIFFNPARSLRNCSSSRLPRRSSREGGGRLQVCILPERCLHPGSARVSRVGLRVPRKRTFAPIYARIISRLRWMKSTVTIAKMRLRLGSGRRGNTDSSVVNLPTQQQIAASLAPNVDYANFSGKFAPAANRGQLTG
jgi:hypothetical protein